MKVFISHTAQAEDLARKIGEGLERQGLGVWRGDEAILPGDNWAEKVSEALNAAQAMVVLLTPDALHSSSVRREIEFALGNENFRQRLITVLVGDARTTSTESLPWILRRLRTIRLTTPSDTEAGIAEIGRALLASAATDSAAVEASA